MKRINISFFLRNERELGKELLRHCVYCISFTASKRTLLRVWPAGYGGGHLFLALRRHFTNVLNHPSSFQRALKQDIRFYDVTWVVNYTVDQKKMTI